MSEITVPLTHGLTVGKAVFKKAVLREPTAGDVIEAQEESEKLVTTFDEKNKPQHEFIPSPTMVGVHVLRRQIKSIDDCSGPLSLDNIKSLHPEDLSLLQEKANELENAAVKVVEEFESRGESEQSGESD